MRSRYRDEGWRWLELEDDTAGVGSGAKSKSKEYLIFFQQKLVPLCFCDFCLPGGVLIWDRY